MSAVVVFEWSFTPPDYFEVPIEIVRDDCMMTIAHGKAEARLDSAVYDANSSIRETLRDGLNDRFLGVQLMTHREYKLSHSTMTRVHPDGRKDVFLEVESARIVITGHPVDFQVRAKDGNIISDSRRDRIDKGKSLAELVNAHRATDSLLASLLNSHAAALRDPNNELVHLYEIRDALSVKFGGEIATRTALELSKSQWSRFGQLCNDEPLRQGRHRGRTGGTLRDATYAELAEARGISCAMIESYLRYLEGLTNP